MKTRKDSEVVGKISKEIGSGEYAQSNIVYQVIKWAFLAGALLSLLLTVLIITMKTQFTTEHFKSVWELFTPLIWASLGYLFGKKGA